MPAIKRHTTAAVAIAMAVLVASALAAPPAERAAPPKWTDSDLAPFFPDARDALVGARPERVAGAPDAAEPAVSVADAADADFAWSQLAAAEVLETEVKRAAARLAPALANPAAFKSGGNKSCSAEFALVAVLFAVIDEYDGDVRWKRDAAALSETFARVSASCKTPTDSAYEKAALRREHLDGAIRGGSFSGEPLPLRLWSGIADRKLLMQRMEQGLNEGVNQRVGRADEFAKSAVEVQHEAQLLALLSEVIHREAYEFWDDDTFVEYANELRAAAKDLARAAAEQDYEAARAATGRAGQACVTCHDGYRL